MPLILPKPGIAEIEEKRSKFIAHCAPVETEKAAKDFIEEIRGRHKQANHNVYAYICGNITRFSDDGEPHGTAGMPVYNVFYKTGVVDFVCVVTRYFGGTLLGAGGLVRAYGKAAKAAMLSAEPAERILYGTYQVTLPYPSLEQLKYNLGKLGAEILNIEYTEKCTVTVRVREELEEEFLALCEPFEIFPQKSPTPP